MKGNKTMKQITTLFALSALFAATATAAAIETTGIDKGALDTTATLSASLASYRAENTQLLEEMAQLRQDFAVFSNAVTCIEKLCETDANWRKAYHQGFDAQTIMTNEFGIVYTVELYKDGYVYANYKGMSRKSEKDPESEAKAKARLEAKRTEAIAAMQRANLPEKIAKMLDARRANAATTNEVTVTVEAQK